VATVKVKLTLNDRNELRSEIDDSSTEERFNKRDARDYFEVIVPRQRESNKNTEERKQKGKIAKGKLVRADDYAGEPAYAHPGIHLDYKTNDELVFCCNKPINIIIEITPDPELVLLQDEDLEPSRKLTKNELLDPKHYPFQDPTKRVLIVNGEDSEPLKLKRVDVHGKPDPNGKADDRVKSQRFYKFSATVMGTPITLDPHIEIHDGD
jgi:hypothetical protein